MELSTLCYLERDGQYLMLHRIKKERDVNAGKWIGVGGHFLEGESPEECLCREVLEETGLRLTRWRFRGIVTFQQDGTGEYMHLFTADRWEGALRACDEGVLQWVPVSEVTRLRLWPGDRIFLRLLQENAPFFSLTLRYRGETLAEAKLDGRALPLDGIG